MPDPSDRLQEPVEAVGAGIVEPGRHDPGRRRARRYPAVPSSGVLPRQAYRVAATLTVMAVLAACSSPPPPLAELGQPVATAAPASTTVVTSTSTSTTTTRPAPVPAATGLLTFRGNPTRTGYGTGPLPSEPRVRWRFPEQPMCSLSSDTDGVHEWCGTGWTGQPAVVERAGRTWVIFGAYDRSVHFLDGATGERLLPDFPTGDIIKGSVTVDPDGYPLVYIGSRDNLLRVIAIDRPVPTELWSLSAYAVSPRLWNDDWDGSPLVSGGYLYEGGENSQFHVVRLDRSYRADGLVAVDPELVFHAPGWDAELLAAVGDGNVSIEGSVALAGGVAYFANSGGLVQGWDVSGVAAGRDPHQVFRYWMGDDVDATVVVDDQGMLYVAAEWERHTERAAQVGQLVKLDPRRPDPLVWSVPDQSAPVAGIWATPAIHRDLVIVPTDGGRLLGVDRATGAIRWSKQLPGPTWQSPVVVDNVLLQGDCAGVLHAYDLSDTRADPPELWSVRLGGCIESTPAVWKGRIYVGTRGGFVYGIG